MKKNDNSKKISIIICSPFGNTLKVREKTYCKSNIAKPYQKANIQLIMLNSDIERI